MKSILTIAIFLSLVVSGAAQTRNVVAGTNGVVVSPTNFWSADVSNARTGLGLGTAATNPASAFQPSSVALSNLAAGNGGSLTNITATIVGTNVAISNVVGLQSALDGKLATNGNTTGTASNVTGVVSLANGGTGGTNATSARTSLGATTVGVNIFTLSNPDEIKFLRLNANSSVSALTAADFRTAIGVSATVGTVTSVGMTVPAIFSLSTPTITSSGTFSLTLANQTSRHALLAPNGGGVPAFRGVEPDDLPSLAISKITGLQTALDGKLATGGTATLATNVTGIVALANGGTSGSNAATARTGLGATTVGGNIFTLINPSAITFLRINADNTVSSLSDANFRTAIGLGTAATNPASAFQPSSSVLTNLAASNGENLTNVPASSVKGVLTLSNGSLTNLTITIGATDRGLYATDGPERVALVVGGVNTLQVFSNSVQTSTGVGLSVSGQGTFSTNVRIGGPLSFTGTNAAENARVTRTNLFLGWTALTNSNAGTGLVSVDTNGEVVSPTNFWQVAPIVTRFVEFDPATNATTNIVAARNLYIHSLVISRTGVTSTIALPITNSFDGDVALVVHQGPTSSVTAVRTADAATNLVTMNQFEQTVEFVFYNNVWQFNHNQSFIEPIYFSGTNATANATTSRDNLGLGTSNVPTFSNVALGIFGGGTTGGFVGRSSGSLVLYGTNVISAVPAFYGWGGFSNLAMTAGLARTNLGLPLAALTNTNSANFQAAVFATNTTPTNAGNFNTHAAWMEVTVQTNGSNVSFRIPLYK
jgi:hypothetical protein